MDSVNQGGAGRRGALLATLVVATAASSVPASNAAGLQAESSRLDQARAEWATLNRLVNRLESRDMLVIVRDGKLLPITREDFAAHLTYKLLAEDMTYEEAVGYAALARSKAREMVSQMRDQMFNLDLEIRALSGEDLDGDRAVIFTGLWILRLQSPGQSGTLDIRYDGIGRDLAATVTIGSSVLPATGTIFESGAAPWVSIRAREGKLDYIFQGSYRHSPARIEGVLEVTRIDGGEPIDRRTWVARRPE